MPLGYLFIILIGTLALLLGIGISATAQPLLHVGHFAELLEPEAIRDT